MSRALAILLLLIVAVAPAFAKVTFDPSGTTLVDGKPFFPVGIYLYQFNTDVLAEVHQQGFNTVIYAVTPKDLDTLKAHGLMTIPYATDEWLAVKDHPSLLAWYLADEPEGWNKTPEMMKKEHDRIRALDPNHPVGLCHYLWAALTNYKDASDFVLSDVYPVLAHREQPLTPVTAHIDEIHRIHGKGFPVWPVIQIFGGPNTDGGKWAQPTPVEVRCMTYMALAHGAKGLMFFSYWPQAPATWAEVGKLARELHRFTPFLTLPSKELAVNSTEKGIHTRCIRIGKSGLLIAVNTDPVFRTATLKSADLKEKSLDLPLENRRISVQSGQLTDRFMPYEVHVYQWGETPR